MNSSALLGPQPRRNREVLTWKEDAERSCKSKDYKGKDGTPSRIRTCDPLLRRQMLYPG
jgi:hypothetical protein